jgi:hypothetical protein
VGKNGRSTGCVRLDSTPPAFFAALLGTDAIGHWQIAPAGEARRVERRYRPGTLVLETEFETDDGLVQRDRPDRPGHLRRGRSGRGLHAYARGDKRGRRRKRVLENRSADARRRSIRASRSLALHMTLHSPIGCIANKPRVDAAWRLRGP